MSAPVSKRASADEPCSKTMADEDDYPDEYNGDYYEDAVKPDNEGVGPCCDRVRLKEEQLVQTNNQVFHFFRCGTCGAKWRDVYYHSHSERLVQDDE